MDFRRLGNSAVIGCCIALLVTAAQAQEKKQTTPSKDEITKKVEEKKAAAAQKTDAKAGAAPDMKAMMEACEKLGALGDNHKLLTYMVGTWDYKNKMWMDPSAPPTESSGTCVSKPVMDGRFFQSEHTGKFKMPHGTEKNFQGISVTGYDNGKQKFVGTWIDNMGTGFMMSEGTYDAASKTFTFMSEMDDPMTPGTKVKVREVIKVIDKDKHVFDWYETRGGQEVKTMEITYTRKAST